MSFRPIRPGTVIEATSSTLPQGFLWADGSAVSRTTYARLFNHVGTSYGTGDGSTTFNVIDKRGRTGVGKDNMGGSAANRMTSAGSGVDGATLGAVGGAQTHTLATGELTTHGHTQDAHLHASYDLQAGSGVASGANLAFANPSGVNTQNTTAANQNTGGGGAHNNTQPSVICNYWVKT